MKIIEWNVKKSASRHYVYAPKVEYTVQKGSWVSRPTPQPGCHYQLSLGGNNDVISITELFLPRGSLVSDIPAGDGKLVNLFLRCSTTFSSLLTLNVWTSTIVHISQLRLFPWKKLALLVSLPWSPPLHSSPLAAPTPQGLQPYSFHISSHHTHVVLTATVGLQAKQLIAMPDCPPETRMHFLPLSWNLPFNLQYFLSLIEI